jgi:hypothetical protein
MHLLGAKRQLVGLDHPHAAPLVIAAPTAADLSGTGRRARWGGKGSTRVDRRSRGGRRRCQHDDASATAGDVRQASVQRRDGPAGSARESPARTRLRRNGKSRITRKDDVLRAGLGGCVDGPSRRSPREPAEPCSSGVPRSPEPMSARCENPANPQALCRTRTGDPFRTMDVPERNARAAASKGGFAPLSRRVPARLG